MTTVNSYLTSLSNATSSMQAQQSKESMGEVELDKYAFLRLMTEQLKYQDPLNPMDNSQFLAQQAQFTMVEELQNLSSTLNSANSLSQSSSMIGKCVTAVNPNNAEEVITGIVKAAYVSDNGAGIQIGAQHVPLDNILLVEDGSAIDNYTTSE